MAAFDGNLFVRLHKWATRQDENFLTECFTFLLEYLAENEPEAAAALVARVTGGIIHLSGQQMRSLQIRTQIYGQEGVPDIELRTGRHFVIIEVKSESVPTPEQLRRYQRLIEQSDCQAKGLILLTRYATSVVGADHYLRWYRIAEWLEQESRKYVFKPACRFLVDQFLGFLHARNMTMSQVTWELPTGVRSMRTLADMLHEAATACGLQASIKGDSEWMGIYLQNRKFWAGILFDSPERLVFGTDYLGVDPKQAKALGIGEVSPSDNKNKDFEWRRDIDLEAEEVHFFARSKASQIQFLEQFLRECVELANSVAAPDQQETPDQQDEGN